jgi:predicted ribosomally synthesized peptide with nif11-like leader
MSVQTVRNFWQKVNDDAELRQKLNAIQGKERQATVAAVTKLAAEAGFHFTAAEYDAAVKEDLLRQHAAEGLNDDELANVSGGRSSGGGSIAGSITSSHVT